jgi:hypothetical protein
MPLNDAWVDPIIEELRRIRDEQAARFDYDLDRIYEHVQQRQERNKAAGMEYVTLEPRRPDPNVLQAMQRLRRAS